MAEDLITRYQLDISDLRLQVKQLEEQFKKLTDAEKKSAKEGEDAFKKTEDAVEKTTESTSKFEEKLIGIGKSIVAAFAVERIISFGAASVQAFAEAERNALKLKTAVGINGGVSSDFDRLLRQSAELQKQSIFDDDAIQAVQTAALQFGLTTDEVEKLTPILLDFATATGQDLNSALSVIISGVNGAARGLKQYGISISENSTAQERYNQILEQANQKFSGQAELIANETTLGAIEKLKNAWGDFTESIGEFIATRTNLTSYLSDFTAIINAGFNVSIARVQKFTQEQMPLAIDAVTQLKKRYEEFAKQDQSGDTTNRIATDLNNQITKAQSRIDTINKTINDLSGDELLNAEQQIGLQRALIQQYTNLKAEVANFGKERSQQEVDYKKLAIKELEELAKNNNVFASKELERRQELSKKKEEQNKKDAEEQKKNLAELQKFTDAANQQSLQSAIKTEEEKIRIQRDAQLKQAQQLFQNAGGARNLEAVKSYNEAVLAIETTYANQIKDAKLKSITAYYTEALKLNEQNSKEELQNSLDAIESNQNQQILAVKEAYVAKGDTSKEAEKKLQDDITKIQLDAERKRAEETLRIKNETIEKERQLEIQKAIQNAAASGNGIGLQLLQNAKFLKDVTDANAKANQDKETNNKEYADALAKLGLKVVDGQIKQIQTVDENWIQSNEEKIQYAARATTEILNFLNILSETQIQQRQDELTRLQESYDAEDEELQLRFEQRLISAAEYEKEQDRIRMQRVATEKKINAEINEIKRKQDIANRAQAIFDVLINTAVAISKLLATPFLATAAGIAGAAQLAAILATPLPKYAKGTKYLQRGNNPTGVDTIPILANEGERIIPTEKNKKYWTIYEAIDGNKFDELIANRYVAPALQKQIEEFKKSESLSFAQNVSNSLMFNHDLLATKIGSEIEWRNRNGIKVKGMQELIDAMTVQTDLRKR
jgi:hypothetical protein